MIYTGGGHIVPQYGSLLHSNPQNRIQRGFPFKSRLAIHGFLPACGPRSPVVAAATKASTGAAVGPFVRRKRGGRQGCRMANFDPFLSLEVELRQGGGHGGAIQGKEGIKFCSAAWQSHSPEARRAKPIRSKNLAIAIWQPCTDPPQS